MLGGDIKVKWSAAEQAADFILDDGDIDLSSDAGIETAIVISILRTAVPKRKNCQAARRS